LREKLNQVLAEGTNDFKQFRLSEALLGLYSFIWDDFCSWYLEMIKPAYGQPIDQPTYERTIESFEMMMTLLHPFMPFVTEEIWHQLRDRLEGEDCIAASWPQAGPFNEAFIREVEEAKEVVSSIRDIRNSKGIKLKDQLAVYAQAGPGAQALLSTPGLAEMVKKMANLEKLEIAETEIPNSVSFLAGADKFYVALTQRTGIPPGLRANRPEKTGKRTLCQQCPGTSG
jgi:valyl-tRNA synthetase